MKRFALLNSIVFVLLSVLLASTASAQVWIGGEEDDDSLYENYTKITGDVRVDGDGVFFNIGNNASITGTVTVNGGGGWLVNETGASITGTVTVNDSGMLHNQTGASIGTITVSGSVDSPGIFNNFGGATVGTANVKGNGMLSNSGRNSVIETLNASECGWVSNYGGAVIETMFFDGSTGGIVDNGSRIETMTYLAGSYSTELVITNGTIKAIETGTIGTLNVAGELTAGANWGTIGNLNFDEGGSVVFNAASVPDGESPFASLKAENVDLANGNILLDLTGTDTLSGLSSDYWQSAFLDSVGGTDGLNLVTLFDDLFVGSEFDSSNIVDRLKKLESFGVQWLDGDTLNSFLIIDQGDFTDGWSDNGGGSLGYEAGNNSSVPEPATLVILGLGLAGLGLARRRRK